MHRLTRIARVAGAIVLLLVFVILGPDFFFAIPWPIRKVAAWVIVAALALLALVRLMSVRPTDAWPVAEAAPRGFVDRLPALLLAIATVSLAIPLLSRPNASGFGDWDFHLQEFEAIRVSILLYHQFPWWNPWSCGGFPLAGEPQCGLFSVATPFVLAFGPGVGLRLGTIACLLVAVEGARRLGRLWFGDPWAGAAVGAVYGLHGGLLVYTVAGHFIPMSFQMTPWLVYFAFRLAEGPRMGVAFGLALALDLLGGLSYPSIYGVAIAGLVLLRGVRVEGGARRSAFLLNAALAFGVALLLAGWRLAVVARVLRDYPRIHDSSIDLTVFDLIANLIGRPDAATLRAATAPVHWGMNFSVGWLGAGLLIMSLRGGWRWWHTLAALAIALSMGATRTWHPSYWLNHLPVFATMHMVTRWLVPAMLGVGLAIGSVLAGGRASVHPAARLTAAGLTVLLVTDLVQYGHGILPVALGETSVADRASDAPPVSVESAPAYVAMMSGETVIRGTEPLLGYNHTRPTSRLWVGHPSYRGEAWTEDGPVQPIGWSPNRIRFQVRPGQIVHINQNPGSWWWVNDRPAFPDFRCAELNQPFTLPADSDGRLELEIRPVGLRVGLALQVVGAAITMVASIGLRRLNRAG